MIQTLDINQQQLELQQKRIMLVGGSVDNQKKLSPEQIKKIEQDYRTMYFGLTSINWSQGMILGMAWQKALQQMEAFIATKNKIANHPVVAHLIKFHSDFKRRVSKHIMDHQGRESEAKLSPRLVKLFAVDGTKMAQRGKDKLNDVYKQYMPQTPVLKNTKEQKFGVAKLHTQQLIQQIMLNQMTRQKAA